MLKRKTWASDMRASVRVGNVVSPLCGRGKNFRLAFLATRSNALESPMLNSQKEAGSMNRRSKYRFIKGILTVTLMAFFFAPGVADAAEKTKVALALPGAVSDKGFNASAHAGLMLIKERFGDDVEVAFSENVQRPDFVVTLRDYANRGFDVIYAHGFQWGDAISKVAAENPDKHFFNVYGAGSGANLANLHVANEQLFYVMGQMAAKLSKSNIVAAVGGWEIPPIRIQVDSFRRGVAAANPDAKFLAIYTGTFYDAVKGKEAARAVISQGADVIAHMADATGLGVIQAAQENNVMIIGYFADQLQVAPDTVASSAIIRVDEMLVRALQSVLDDKFKSGVNNFGMESGILQVGSFGAMVPQKVKDEIADLVEKIKSGEVKIPPPNVAELMKDKINKL